jgi:EAL domain-containing protein (putative c-di-GMP-specific phosphodiesterase class I)/GGDEF domain-containing protein
LFRSDPAQPQDTGPLPPSGGEAASGPEQAGGGLALALAVFAIAFFACLVARLISPSAPGVLLVWPAAGVALAFAWRSGTRWVLPAAAGAALWAWADTRLPGATAAAFAASAAGPALAVRLMRQLGDWKPADYRLDASVRFAMLVILVAAPVDALIAALGLPASIGGAESNPVQRFAVWWLIDALGMLLLAPALLAWVGNGDRGLAAATPEPPGRSPLGARPGIAIPDSAALIATAVVAGLSATLSVLGHPDFAHALLFLFFPVVAWTAIRCDERVTALTLLITGLPLLALRAWQTGLAGAPGHEALEAAVLLFCAVIVALMLQATAADRRFALARMARQAREDMSTGLLNDRGLIAEVGERLATPGRPDYGLIGLHVTNFDTLNDLCGALQAMQLEQDLAALLRRQPGLCAAARLSAGRFALLVEADSVARVRGVAREIYSQFNGQLFRTEHGSVRLQMCVGGLLVDRNAQIDSEDCIVSLSDALAIAASVRDPQLFVEPLSQTMIDARRSHQARIEQIREAIRDQRFVLHAQPMIDPEAPPDKLSFEVLLRLLDRDGSLIRPPEFLSLAGQAQMTPAMDRGVIRAVFSWLAAHPEALARTWKCSINLSGLTMSDGTIAGFIREQRALHGIPAELIVFEITESEAIRNPAAASRLVDDLKAEGFGIALDDFGTGLATFEYLKRFPLDYLKIDGSFIRNLTTSPIDEEIVLSTVRVAQRLNVRTVAEHVHSREVLDRVTELGIGHLQGNLIGSACPLAELFRTASSQSPFVAPADLRTPS